MNRVKSSQTKKKKRENCWNGVSWWKYGTALNCSTQPAPGHTPLPTVTAAAAVHYAPNRAAAYYRQTTFRSVEWKNKKLLDWFISMQEFSGFFIFLIFAFNDHRPLSSQSVETTRVKLEQTLFYQEMGSQRSKTIRVDLLPTGYFSFISLSLSLLCFFF